MRENGRRYLLLWEQEVAGSNPATPTSKIKGFRRSASGILFHLHKSYTIKDPIWLLTYLYFITQGGEGWKDYHNRIYRLYCLEGLNLRSKRHRRSKSGTHRLIRPHVDMFNQRWSMDFMSFKVFESTKKV